MITHVEHTFKPVYNCDSKVLILGTMPSVKSREQGFYYGHPQNRFWRVLAQIVGDLALEQSGTKKEVPQSIDEKRRMLLSGGIAVWDVLTACDIEGSDDSSIRNPEPAEIGSVLGNTDIKAIFCNGDKAYRLYLTFFGETAAKQGWPPVKKLPSTSPANAAWSFERLTDAWRAELWPFLTKDGKKDGTNTEK